MLTSRSLDILSFLSENNNFSTRKTLATFLQVSQKTISRDIQVLQFFAKQNNSCGFQLETRAGKGIYLSVTNATLFNNLNIYQKKELSIKYNEELSPNGYELLKLLLTTTNYLSIENLAQILFMSESSIYLELKQVKHLLRRYSLTLETLSTKGIKIIGKEMNIRLCIARYIAVEDIITNVETNLIMTKDFAKVTIIRNHVLKIFKKYDVKMRDNFLDNFITHIYISIYRINQGNYVAFQLEEQTLLQTNETYKIAQELVELLANDFPIRNLEEEIIYITVQLLGKKTTADKNITHISDDIKNVLNQIFIAIKEEMHIDLSKEKEIYEYLIMHFGPMFIRLKYGMASSNPLVDEIKIRKATSFEMGLIAKRIIYDTYDYLLDDNEVSYLAIYFSLALEHLQEKPSRKNIVIVCGLGMSSSRMLMYKLKQKYDEAINEILVCQIYELDTIPLNEFDCIISTVPIKDFKTKLPLIILTDFLDDINDEKLDRLFFYKDLPVLVVQKILPPELFIHETAIQTPKQVIEKMLSIAQTHFSFDDSLKKNIFDREELSSTAYGQQIAIPHPIKPCTDETFLSIMILDKPIKWQTKLVKYVFLFSPQKNNSILLQTFNDLMAQFILTDEVFKKFTDNPTYECFCELFSLLQLNH